MPILANVPQCKFTHQGSTLPPKLAATANYFTIKLYLMTFGLLDIGWYLETVIVIMMTTLHVDSWYWHQGQSFGGTEHWDNCICKHINYFNCFITFMLGLTLRLYPPLTRWFWTTVSASLNCLLLFWYYQVLHKKSQPSQDLTDLQIAEDDVMANLVCPMRWQRSSACLSL